jgi:hypothetical protein
MVDRHAGLAHFGGDPWRCVGAVVNGMHRPDLAREVDVGGLSRRPGGGSGPPVVSSWTGRSQRPGTTASRRSVRGGDELEAIYQRVSPAKYRAAAQRLPVDPEVISDLRDRRTGRDRYNSTASALNCGG